MIGLGHEGQRHAHLCTQFAGFALTPPMKLPPVRHPPDGVCFVCTTITSLHRSSTRRRPLPSGTPCLIQVCRCHISLMYGALLRSAGAASVRVHGLRSGAIADASDGGAPCLRATRRGCSTRFRPTFLTRVRRSGAAEPVRRAALSSRNRAEPNRRNHHEQEQQARPEDHRPL